MTTTRDRVSTTPTRELVEAALGFTPDDSLVLTAHAPCGAIMRADLNDLLDSDASGLFEALAATLAANRVRTVTVLYYTRRSPNALTATDAQLTAALEEAGVSRANTAIVDDAPRATRASDTVVTSCEDSAERRAAVEAFRNAAPDLADYLATLEVVQQGLEPSARELGEGAAALSALSLRDAVVVHLTGTALPESADDDLSDETVARAMATMLDPSLGTKPTTLTSHHLEVLQRIIALLPPELCAPAHTIAAMCEWWAADHKSASAHLEAALRIDPNYRLAHLLALAFSRGLQPGWTARA